MSRLVLVAAGGLAREAVEAVRAARRDDVVAILDDDESRWGTTVTGVPVPGGLESIADYPDALVVICAGKGAIREMLAKRLAGLGVHDSRFGTVVHPSVALGGSSTVGAGSILLAGVVLTADVRIGRHVVAMPNAVFTHDDDVDDYATVCAGVALGGWVSVGSGAYLGMASSVRERVRIGAGALVGMGAAVLRDVPEGQTWAGVPARRLGGSET